jgi:hypothetical protein
LLLLPHRSFVVIATSRRCWGTTNTLFFNSPTVGDNGNCTNSKKRTNAQTQKIKFLVKKKKFVQGFGGRSHKSTNTNAQTHKLRIKTVKNQKNSVLSLCVCAFVRGLCIFRCHPVLSFVWSPESVGGQPFYSWPRGCGPHTPPSLAPSYCFAAFFAYWAELDYHRKQLSVFISFRKILFTHYCLSWLISSPHRSVRAALNKYVQYDKNWFWKLFLN